MIFLPKAVILDFKMASNDGFRKIFIDIDVKLCRFHWAQAVSQKMKRLKLSSKNASKSVCKAAAARSAKVHAICEQCQSNRISCAEYLQQIKLKFSPSNI